MSKKFISVIVPVFNEEKYIKDFIDSLIPIPDDFEFFFIDGKSQDNTIAEINKYKKDYPNIKILNNPERSQAVGLNVAINKITSEYITRLDAHAFIDSKKYYQNIRLSINYLDKKQAGIVGFKQRFAYKTKFQIILKIISLTPFMSGLNIYRYCIKPTITKNTCWLFLCKSELAKSLNGFNALAAPNEDYDFNKRAINFTKLPLIVNPLVPIYYFPRETYQLLFKQYWRYGYSRMATILRLNIFSDLLKIIAVLITYLSIIAFLIIKPILILYTYFFILSIVITFYSYFSSIDKLGFKKKFNTLNLLFKLKAHLLAIPFVSLVPSVAFLMGALGKLIKK